MRNRGNIPNPLGLTHPEHVVRYNVLGMLVVATHYYDEDSLTRLDLLDDIRWLFAWEGIGQFLDIKDHTYRDLTPEFLSASHKEVTSSPHCQE